MINLKIGGALLLGGAALFVMSETLLGNFEVAAAYAMFLGLVMFLVGLILTLVGLIQVFISRLKYKSK
jgi:hypothetical protein